MNVDLKSKERFTERAKNYSKYRPTYPDGIISYLTKNCGLNSDDTIADIGSGSGISSKLFLDFGNKVYGIEPNLSMRTEAEDYLCNYDDFCSRSGSAEHTEMESKSIDYIVSAQAFHWFDPVPTKQEFRRILKDDGQVVLLWNARKSSATGFTSQLIEIVKKYSAAFTNTKQDKDPISDFFGDNEVVFERFDNPQVCNLERIIGELSSYSYLPNEGDVNHKAMIDEVKSLFEKYKNTENEVVLMYETKMYIGKLEK